MKDASDAHVLVVDAFDGATLDSWDYGQGPLAPAPWAKTRAHLEGRRRRRRVSASPAGQWRLEDGRWIQSVLPLAAVLRSRFENETPATLITGVRSLTGDASTAQRNPHCPGGTCRRSDWR